MNISQRPHDHDKAKVKLISPYGGKLVNLVARGEERSELIYYAISLPCIQLSPRSICDIELLAVGGFSPLDRFMGKADYDRVLEEMRMSDGTLFPIPITLPVAAADSIREGEDIALRSQNNDLLAVMTIDEVFKRDTSREAELVYGTMDDRHPLVAEMASWPLTTISGPLRVINVPKHYDFVEHRRTPTQVRTALNLMGYPNVVAFQTRNPIHRAHEELTKRATRQIDGTLLIHPVVGLTKPGDIDHFTRVRSYRVLVENHYDEQRTLLSLLPLAMRMAGPREAVWHAIIRRNYGAKYFIVGRDHAGPGVDSQGRPFYGPYDAQKLLQEYEQEVGVKMIPYKELVYLPEEKRYEEIGKVPEGARIASLSGTDVRTKYLGNGKRLPDWFTHPEAATILSSASPPNHQRGFCVWLTGLSGAGKSTIAEILVTLLMEHGRQVTLLDGDVVRTHLSKGLGFSKEDRDTNIRRIGFVAAEIVRHHGVAVCAAISPYRATRDEIRNMVGERQFIEVFVVTSLEACERRDPKGLYAKARRGKIKGFTGIDDLYEEPLNPEIRLTTTDCLPEGNANRIIHNLGDRGFLCDGVQTKG